MKVHEGHRHVPRLAAPCVAIGNFDGVHLGHRALLAAARARADQHGGTALALTFDPHPSVLLSPHLAPPAITSLARKLELIGESGIDATVVEPFTPELAALPADDFIEQLLVGAIGVRHVIVGYDFGYGHGRGGTTASLAAHGARRGFDVDVVERVTLGGETVSSTRIRGYLRGGDIAAARRLLGRDFDVDGVVVHGARRGAALGFPTANIRPDIPIALAPGIYACWLDDRPAVASLGTNPTFTEHGGALVLEVHVLDFSGDLYDRRVRVRFAAHLRDEARFDSVDALVAQIRRDAADAREILPRMSVVPGKQDP
jgi:riboflavin kinase/FMN adenylyltransferase